MNFKNIAAGSLLGTFLVVGGLSVQGPNLAGVDSSNYLADVTEATKGGSKPVAKPPICIPPRTTWRVEPAPGTICNPNTKTQPARLTEIIPASRCGTLPGPRPTRSDISCIPSCYPPRDNSWTMTGWTTCSPVSRTRSEVWKETPACGRAPTKARPEANTVFCTPSKR